MQFTKYHALGNDYLVIPNPRKSSANSPKSKLKPSATAISASGRMAFFSAPSNRIKGNSVCGYSTRTEARRKKAATASGFSRDISGTDGWLAKNRFPFKPKAGSLFPRPRGWKNGGRGHGPGLIRQCRNSGLRTQT